MLKATQAGGDLGTVSVSELEWTIVCGESWRDSGALVSRVAERSVKRHDHPRTRRALLREFCRRCSRLTPLPVVDREAGVDVGITRLATIAASDGGVDGNRESEAFGPQATQTAAVGAGESPAGRKDQPTGTRRGARLRSRNRGGAGSAGLSPQAGFGVGSREPSDPRRGPQHRGDGHQPSARPGHRRCRVGSVRADHRRQGQSLRAHTSHQVSRWLASSKTCSACGHRLNELGCKSESGRAVSCGAVHDRDHNAAKIILAAGRAERLHASHESGRDRAQRFRWSPHKTSYHSARSQGDEAGSRPNGGVNRHSSRRIVRPSRARRISAGPAGRSRRLVGGGRVRDREDHGGRRHQVRDADHARGVLRHHPIRRLRPPGGHHQGRHLGAAGRTGRAGAADGAGPIGSPGSAAATSTCSPRPASISCRWCGRCSSGGDIICRAATGCG